MPYSAESGTPALLPARPFLELLTDYGSPWSCEERDPA